MSASGADITTADLTNLAAGSHLADWVTNHDWRGHKVLLTGSRGFVGQRLKHYLNAAGANVTELLRPDRDLTRADSLAGCCDGVHTVIHAAGSAHVNHIDPGRVRAVNVDGTANLLAEASQSGVTTFVLISSILADPAVDTPRSVYGQSKADAEELLIQACQPDPVADEKMEDEVRMRGVIVRPVNVYGPGMRGNLMTLLKLIRKRRLPPLPRLESRLALVGVDDFCQAVILMAESGRSTQTATAQTPPDGSKPLHSPPPVYPVTDGQTYHLKEIERGIRSALGQKQPAWALPVSLCFAAVLLAEILGRLLPWKNVPGLRTWRTITRDQPVDDSKTRQELGYNPRSNFYDALPAIIQHESGSE
jgi:UDP-glucose 4-epimerase